MDIGRVMLISLANGCFYHLWFFSFVCFVRLCDLCICSRFLGMLFVLTSRLGHIVIRHSEMLPSSGAPLANLHISNLHISNLHNSDLLII